jgi:hypothetical protein
MKRISAATAVADVDHRDDDFRRSRRSHARLADLRRQVRGGARQIVPSQRAPFGGEVQTSPTG